MPSNDAFTGATPTVPGTQSWTTVGATHETGEWYGTGGRTVWFTYSPTASGLLDVVVPAVSGVSLSLLVWKDRASVPLYPTNPPDGNVNGSTALHLSGFPVVAGSTYHLQLDSSADTSGTFTLTFTKTGVLKVNVGDAVTPVWRSIGCGGGPTNFANTGWSFTTGPTTANGQTVTWRYDGASPPTSPIIYQRYASDGTNVSGGINPTSSGSAFAAYSLTFTEPAGTTLTRFQVYDQTGSIVELDWQTAAAGRLKLRLPDGTWVREKCDSDGGGTFADAFTRSNRSLNGDNGWTCPVGTMSIVSNAAAATAISAVPAVPYSTSHTGWFFADYMNACAAAVHDGGASSDLWVVEARASADAAAISSFSAPTGLLVLGMNDAQSKGVGFAWQGYGGLGVVEIAVTGSASEIATASVPWEESPNMNPGVARTYRLEYQPSTAAARAYVDGALVASGTTTRLHDGPRAGIASRPGQDDSGVQTDGGFTFDDFATTTGGPVARPLKMWDGTTWQTVACMVPAT